LAEVVAGIGTGGTVLSNNVYLKARNAADGADIEWMKLDSSDNLQLNAGSGKSIKLTVAKTPIPNFPSVDVNGFTADLAFKAGVAPRMVPYTVTAATTPVVGTNMLLPGYNIVPTVAANAKAILMPATGADSTPIAGKVYQIYNQGGNTIHIVAGGGATMNEATAGGYLALATKLSATCFSSSTSNYDCRLNVNPTPAGP
jgi:hypothetical protein